ncbi:Porin family, mycobacterial-type [Mycobacteriaceae bacterium]
MVRGVAIVAFAAMLAVTAAPVSAEPDPATPGGAAPVPAADGAAPGVDPAALSAAPVDDGKVVSTPPATTTAPDGSTLTISAKDETQMAVAPLTTAISSRAYVVGGVFRGSITGVDETPEGVFQVGYEIGCGIDMSTSGGVLLNGNGGLNASIGYFGLDFEGTVADGLVPGVGGQLGGSVTVGLKPGIINNVPVTKKRFKGADPWVSISNFRITIDGCVGESFIRSYVTISNSSEEGESILSWFGTTKAV